MTSLKPKIICLGLDSYLAFIKNSVGTKSFRNFYALVDGKKTDILKKGDLSCAFFVSSVLVIFKLIKEVHTTVDSTIKDLQNSGWQKIKRPKVGCVLVWESKADKNGSAHRHVGFYLGQGQAISNNSKLGSPSSHHPTFNGQRKIEAIFWPASLK